MAVVPGIAERTLDELLLPQGRRRQPMPGFDREFADIVDYIVRITHRIWDRHDIAAIRRYYSEACPVWTLGGPVAGAEAVIRGTIATMAEFPDRTMVPEAVIWSGNGKDGFLSSHRILSDATHLGPGGFGPPTGRAIRFRTIADCLCRENRIVEEWLARDTSGMAIGLGLDPADVARATPPSDSTRAWWAAMLRDVCATAHAPRGRGSAVVGSRGFPAAHLSALLAAGLSATDAYDPDAVLQGAGGEERHGPAAISDWWAERGALVGDRRLRIDHVASNPVSGDSADGIDMAVRWWLAGQHAGNGRWGAATGRDLLVLGITHWRIRDGRIVEEVSLFDEIAVLRQLLPG
jgi:predicted ester cyclase